MNRAQLRQALDEAGVSRGTYNLGDRPVVDCDHVLRPTAEGWLVYFFERGILSDQETYPTEAEACAKLWERLVWARKRAAERGTEPQ